jgi:hypothetical protein
MASYQYTVTGVEPPMSLSEQASDHAAARQEAVLFLSELLRDLAVANRDGSDVRVEVRLRGVRPGHGRSRLTPRQVSAFSRRPSVGRLEDQPRLPT